MVLCLRYFVGVDSILVHPTAIIDHPCKIGTGTRVWHFTHVMKGAQIGERCVLGQNVFVAGTAVLGDGVKVQNNVSIYDGVVLDDDVFCGPSCVFTNVTHPRAFVERKQEFASTRVGRGATIGANATVVCGVTIGEYALIGAGAVVTHDVAPYAIVVGTPARQRGWACRCGETLPAALECARCGAAYAVDRDRCQPR